MKRVVADASIAGAWLLPDEHSPSATKLLRELIEGRLMLAVPDLWTHEMTNLLVSACRRKRIDEEQADEALQLIASLPPVHLDHSSPSSRERTLRLAIRFGLSGYDAAYLELADRLQCPLHTADKKLAQAAAALGITT